VWPHFGLGVTRAGLVRLSLGVRESQPEANVGLDVDVVGASHLYQGQSAGRGSGGGGGGDTGQALVST
jgi:hypothetical protein